MSTYPLCFIGTVFLILAPHPSLLYVLVDFHLQTLHKPFLFGTHLIATYTLTFMALSSLMVCVVRDPGPVTSKTSSEAEGDDEIGVTEALMPDIDFSSPGSWCRKCWVISNVPWWFLVADVSIRPLNLNEHTIARLVAVVY